MEDLIARLNQELAMNEYLNTKVCFLSRSFFYVMVYRLYIVVPSFHYIRLYLDGIQCLLVASMGDVIVPLVRISPVMLPGQWPTMRLNCLIVVNVSLILFLR